MFKKVEIGDHYLHRTHIIPRNRFFNIYLHRFVGSDKRLELHDHPWHFVAILFSGGITETYLTDTGWYAFRRLPRFIPRFYKATHQHRFDLSMGKHGATTLVITGPRFRKWGFYKDKILTQIMSMEDR